MPEVNKADLYMFLVSSGRYAWMRSTYIVDSTAEAIKKYAPYLTDGELEVLHRDVREAIQDWAKTEASTSIKQHDCDRKTLSDLNMWLAAERNRRNIGHGDDD